jgi:hypothetical protein
MGVFQNNLMGAAAAAASAGGGDFYTHQIANSVRNSAAQDGTLKFTAGTPTSGTTFTMSYWVKRYDNGTDGGATNIFVTGTGGGTYIFIGFGANIFDINFTGGIYGDTRLQTNALYRDTSAWYHHVLRFDSTQAATTNRLRLYVNGVEPTYSSQTIQAQIDQDEDWDFINESGIVQAFGGLSGKGHGTEGANLQMAEIVFNDGQSYGPDSYGETKNGVWIPKDPSGLTFGNNGYYLKFESSSDLGNDSSGNNNDFTAANLATHDQMLDSPTFSSTDGNGGNYSTLLGKLLRSYGRTFTMSEGNLKYAGTNSGETSNQYSTMGASSGKWYAEFLIETVGANSAVGIAPSEAVSYDNSIAYTNQNSPGGMGYLQNGNARFNNSDTSSGYDTYTTGDVIQVAMDIDNTRVWFGKNNTWQNSGDPAAGSNASYTDWTTQGTFSTWHFATAIGGTSGVHICNFGQEGTFAGEKTAGGNADGSGYGNFLYAPPTGFLAMCAGNLPTADAVDPAQTDDDYPQKLLGMENWVGTGSTLSVTGLGFQPDFVYFKSADQGGVYSNWWTYDSTRGVTKSIQFNEVDVETTRTTGLTAFGADGVSVGASTGSHYGAENTAGTLITIICIRVNGGTTAANSVGDTDSVTQVDPSGAFSIVTYTGTGSATTIGHGLSAAPDCIIVKDRGATNNWAVYHGGVASDAQTDYLLLDSNAAVADDSTYWNDTTPTTSVFSIGTNADVNTNTNTYVAYAFANIEGYTKFSTYVGNGNADGPFVYCGFLPKVIWLKRYDSTGNWNCYKWDYTSVNSGYISLGMNEIDTRVEVNTTDNRSTSTPIDFLSNGFKIRVADGDINVDTGKYLVMAWASNPFQYSSAF